MRRKKEFKAHGIGEIHSRKWICNDLTCTGPSHVDRIQLFSLSKQTKIFQMYFMSKTISIRIYLSIIFLSVYISNYEDKHTLHPISFWLLDVDGSSSSSGDGSISKMVSCIGIGCQDKWNLNGLNRTEKKKWQQNSSSGKLNKWTNEWARGIEK